MGFYVESRHSAVQSRRARELPFQKRPADAAGGKRQQRLANVAELPLLELGQLVGYYVVEGPRLTAGRQLADAGGRDQDYFV